VSPPRGRLANHLGPEPCVTTREGEDEASAGECTGQPLSRERSYVPGADAFQIAEGNTDGCVIASTWTARRGRRPWHVQTLLAREPGGLEFGLQTDTAGPRREGEEP
jgi:hypothetical protein